MVNDYAENLFEAMEIVAKYYYDDKKFDETIIATIVDDSDRKQGRYVVTNGTIKFDAYADSQDYKVNDVVRVTILKGDYSDKKYIVGRGIKNETGSAITLVPPSDTVLNMTGNLVSISENENLKLIANSKQTISNPADKNASYEAKQLWRISIDDETYNKQWQNSTYDSIVLKADFSSRLSNYSPSAGHYGLWLDVYILMSEERKTVIQKRFYLDSKDMFGDPYNFIVPSSQEISFSLTPGEKISAMELYFYQSNDFILNNNYDKEIKDIANIFVNNIYLYLGNDISKIEDNKLVIHTHDSLLYNGSGMEDVRQRVLELTWYNKNENNQYLGFSDSRIDKNYDEIEYLNLVKNPPEDGVDFSQYDNLYCIYWYKYVDSYPGDEDLLGEQNWQRIVTETSNIGLPNIEDSEGYYPIYAEQTTLTVEPDITESVSKYKAVLIYNHELFHSNELIFTNVVQSTATPTLNNISIIHADNSKDAYPIYGIDGKLINMADYAKIRKIKVQYLDGWGQLSNKYLANATVYWYIPDDNTMLRCYEYDYDNFQKEETSIIQKDGYKCFYKTIRTNYETGLVENEDLFFPYRIKDYYVLSNKNNKIYCVIKTVTQTLETFIDFSFSSFGNNGTDYSLIIKPIGPEVVITSNPNQKCKFEISLYNSNNENVDISNLNMDISIDNNQITSNFDGQILTINSDGMDNRQGGILTIKVPVQDGGLWPKEIVGQYAIPWAWQSTYYMIGTSTIVYDSYGGAPIYYKEPLVLCDGKEKIKNGSWSIEYYYPSDADDDNKKAKARQFLPIIKDNVLIPCNMYVANTIGASLVYKDDKDKIVYCQPLLITQNKYASSMLNSWDGELVLNETNETILTNLIGSGKKELEDNTFSGVLLGEVASAGIDDELTDTEKALKHSHTGIGLYGFHHGAQSFGFNVNGTAFIGKSGGGRIAFDGNQGYIYSANWLYHLDGTERAISELFERDDENNIIGLKPGEQGMAIDLKNGYIDASNFKLTSTGIVLNSNPSDDPDSENKYYLAIGNLHKEDTPTSTYIKYDSSGNLEIKVSKFELIGAYGADNLLNNTAPIQPTVDIIQTSGEPKHSPSKDNILKATSEEPNKSAWTSFQRFGASGQSRLIDVWSALQGSGKDVYKCIGIDNTKYTEDKCSKNDNGQVYRTIYQIFDDNNLSPGTYILTGYVWNNGTTQLKFIFGNDETYIEKRFPENEDPWEEKAWNRISITFTTQTALYPKFRIIDYPTKSGTYRDDTNNKEYPNYPATYFRELKLESGSIGSSWTSSVFDIEGYNKTIIEAELKTFENKLNQDYIYTKLTNGEKAKGIYINSKNNEDNLYINANYITGTLGSLNNNIGVCFNVSDKTFILAQSDSTYINYSNEKLSIGGLTHTGDFTINNGNLQIGTTTLTEQNLIDILSLLDKGENGV